MIVPPTVMEWYAIYAPLSVLMVLTILTELRTTRIPNAIVYPTCAYVVVARMAIGPLPFAQYLISIMVIAVVYIGIGYGSGFLGAGAAKFAVAMAAALVPWMAFVVGAASLIGGGAFWLAFKIWDRPGIQIPGSILISSLTTGVILLTILHAEFHLF